MADYAQVQVIAAEALGWFETRKRSTGDEFVGTKDGRPDWLTAIINDAHGDMFPDDHKYAFVLAALDAITDCGNEDDARQQAEEPDVYTSDLTAWLHSHNGRVYYVTEALETGDVRDGFQLLGYAQSQERAEVFASVYSSLESLADEREAESDDEDADDE